MKSQPLRVWQTWLHLPAVMYLLAAHHLLPLSSCQATAYWTVSSMLAASPGISAGRCCLGKRTVKWSFVAADLFALM